MDCTNPMLLVHACIPLSVCHWKRVRAHKPAAGMGRETRRASCREREWETPVCGECPKPLPSACSARPVRCCPPCWLSLGPQGIQAETRSDVAGSSAHRLPPEATPNKWKLLVHHLATCTGSDTQMYNLHVYIYDHVSQTSPSIMLILSHNTVRKQTSIPSFHCVRAFTDTLLPRESREDTATTLPVEESSFPASRQHSTLGQQTLTHKHTQTHSRRESTMCWKQAGATLQHLMVGRAKDVRQWLCQAQGVQHYKQVTD